MVWNETVSSDRGRPGRPPTPPSTTVEEVVLDWAPLRGASAYELQISPDQYFNAPIGGTLVVNSTSYSPSPTLPAGSYYWRVRGLSTAAGGRAEPVVGRVGLHPSVAGCATPPPGRDGTETDNVYAQVQLLKPADGDYTTSPSRSSRGGRNARLAMYEFNVGTDANFSPGTYSTCLTNHTVVSPYTRVTLRRTQLRPRQTWTRGRSTTGASARLTTSPPTPRTPRSMASTATCAPSSTTRARCPDCPRQRGDRRQCQSSAGRPLTTSATTR